MRRLRRGMVLGLALAGLLVAGVAVQDEPVPAMVRMRQEVSGESRAPTTAGRQFGLPQVAEPAATPRARIAPLDPQVAPDLWAHAQASLASGRLEDLERASAAWHLCAAVLDDADDRRRSFNGGDAALANAEHRLASEEITRRCLGFERLGAGQRQQWFESLRARLIAAGSRFAEGPCEESAALPSDAVVALLREPGAPGFERARPALAAAMARQFGIEDTDDRLALDTALLLAGCHFGRVCSPSSFDALRRCTYQGVCNQGLFDHWRQLVPSTHHDRVVQWQQMVERAIASQRWNDLGL